MRKNKKEGFIVHPFETSDSKYHASYGNNNKTLRSFNTLREAKAFLHKKGMTSAMYDSPSGVKTLDVSIMRPKHNSKKDNLDKLPDINWW